MQARRWLIHYEELGSSGLLKGVSLLLKVRSEQNIWIEDLKR